jgi:hypothetical protein
MSKFILILFFASAAWANPLSERVISSGFYAGERLIDIVKYHTSEGHDGERIQIPEKAVDDAFEFFDRYHNTKRTFFHMALYPVEKRPQYSEFRRSIVQATAPTIGNHKFMVIFDLSQPRTAARLHIINLHTGMVSSIEASHGFESECANKPLFACNFISNRDSTATPLGFFATGRSYYGEKHAGLSITMDGLELGSANRLPGGNIFPSTIIIHSAKYVREGYAGRSHGCVSLSQSNMDRFDTDLSGGALFYFYHSSLENSGPPVVSGLL